MPEKKVKILLDLPVEDGVLGFGNYRDALVNIIKDSEPRFTIGIFGGWGTGKTTLMRMMKKKLDDDREITVWFNPWQYEKEEHLSIPLLQTINLELKNRKLLKTQTLEQFGKAILALISGISVKIPIGVEISSKDAIETYQKLLESKNSSSLYFELRQQLSEVVKELNTKGKSKIIIFIDDLDRCLPEEALQVLESVKVTLDMEGYVFALGLSREIIEKCVDKKYGKESGISGTDYIKKIIQVPFSLPGLREQEVKTYVQRLKEQLKETDAKEHVEKYIDIISKGMEANPREIKRFINNFVLINQISAGETKLDELLVLLIIQFRWEGFYKAIAEHKADFLDSVVAYMKEGRDARSEKGKQEFIKQWGYLDLIEKTLDTELRSFLKDQGKILFSIPDLDPYIHFSKTMVTSEVRMPVESNYEKTDLNQLIREVIQHFENRLRLNGIDIETNLIVFRPFVNVDRKRIEQVLFNLIENAIEAMPKGGTLTIGTKANEKFAIFEVEDTGSGISEENLEKIWVPFFTTRSKGSGLGLPVCRKIIEEHHGYIEVKTEVEKGTKFTVYLP